LTRLPLQESRCGTRKVPFAWKRMTGGFNICINPAEHLLDRTVVMFSERADKFLERCCNAGLYTEQALIVEHDAKL
jgi:hypothetical protein